MFTPEDREAHRAALVAAARADPRVVAAALTGSAAVGREDRWSDIDLAFGIAQEADRDAVVADWTERMYQDFRAVHHVDVWRDATRFRVFLIDSTLQVDIAFWPESDFGAIGPAFRLLFGRANDIPAVRPRSAEELIGMAWLHGLHVRSSLARGRVWQAEHMLSGMRGQVLALACLRHDLQANPGLGMDDLPPTFLTSFGPAIARSLEPDELRRAFAVTGAALLAEAGHVDVELANRFRPTLMELTG